MLNFIQPEDPLIPPIVTYLDHLHGIGRKLGNTEKEFSHPLGPVVMLSEINFDKCTEISTLVLTVAAFQARNKHPNLKLDPHFHVCSPKSRQPGSHIVPGFDSFYPQVHRQAS